MKNPFEPGTAEYGAWELAEVSEPTIERPGSLPAPAKPMKVARALVNYLPKPWAWWRDDFYTWSGARYEAMKLSEVRNLLYRLTEHATYTALDKEGKEQTRDWDPDKKRIDALADALGTGVLHRAGDAEQCMSLTNGVLEVGDGRRTLLPHDPARFNLYSLPFAYDRTATAPQWLRFLNEVLPGDAEAHGLIAEWFGYVLSGKTDLQKMLSLVGPTRSGKGTIARVLSAMVGDDAIASPDIDDIGGQFGKQGLIGKQLAIMSDVRWSGAAQGAVKTLLAIVGEDSLTVPRKNREDWHGTLDARFMVMSNDDPQFKDVSGALSGRMLHVEFRHSFLGREDPALTGKLLGELPGILNWALDGLERLRKRGHFIQPASGQDLADDVRRSSSPHAHFVEECCVLDPASEIRLEALYDRYKAWILSTRGKDDERFVEALNRFSASMRSAFRGADVEIKRPQINGRRVQMVYGIRLSEVVAAVPVNRWLNNHYAANERPF